MIFTTFIRCSKCTLEIDAGKYSNIDICHREFYNDNNDKEDNEINDVINGLLK